MALIAKLAKGTFWVSAITLTISFGRSSSSALVAILLDQLDGFIDESSCFLFGDRRQLIVLHQPGLAATVPAILLLGIRMHAEADELLPVTEKLELLLTAIWRDQIDSDLFEWGLGAKRDGKFGVPHQYAS